MFSLSKGAILRKIVESPYLQEQAYSFVESKNTQKKTIEAGEKALAFLYSNGKQQNHLNKLRHVKYVQKLSSSTSAVEPKRLPPTAAAAQFHSLRVYFQVQEWLSLATTVMNPLEWGGKSPMELWFQSSLMLQLLLKTCYISFAATAKQIVSPPGVPVVDMDSFAQ